MSVTRLDGAETYYAPSRTSGDGDGHLITVHNGAASCTCPAANGSCWAVRELMGSSGSVGDDALLRLRTVARDRALLADREAAAVASARSEGVSWHRLAVALGRTSEGVRKRYKASTP